MIHVRKSSVASSNLAVSIKSKCKQAIKVHKSKTGCDNSCKGCEKNSCGWCSWKDRATPYYKTEAFKVESKYEKPYEWGDEYGYVKH